MNHKFIKNLKIVCKRRRQSPRIWLEAFKDMPVDVQKKFKADVLKDAKKIREEQFQAP